MGLVNGYFLEEEACKGTEDYIMREPTHPRHLKQLRLPRVPLELADAPRFGGFAAIRVTKDGLLLGVTRPERGLLHWLTMEYL